MRDLNQSVRTDAHGVYRVGETRVMLESVIVPYLHGDSPESIQDAYPALSLKDVQSAIAFFLANRAEVEIYLERQELIWQQLRAEQDRNPSPVVLRLRFFRDRCRRRHIPF